MEKTEQAQMVETERQTSEFLSVATQEMNKTAEALEKIANEVKEYANHIQPILENQIKILRSARMGASEEINRLLSSMRDVRMFFLAETYQMEISRMKEFLDICERFKKLQADGTLDLIGDVILKLAVGNEKGSA